MQGNVSVQLLVIQFSWVDITGYFSSKIRKWFCPGAESKRDGKEFVFESLRPTYTHEAIYKLMEVGHIKLIISQNTDGLHRLSGVPRDKLLELHGNSFHEKCEKCGARYERPYAVLRLANSKVPPRLCVHCKFDHRTGRLCERKVSC